MAADQVSRGAPDGTTLGQSASDKVGMHGSAVAQAATTTAPAATAATNSSPYGYSQAQADAIVTWIRAVDTALKNKGFIASS